MNAPKKVFTRGITFAVTVIISISVIPFIASCSSSEEVQENSSSSTESMDGILLISVDGLITEYISDADEFNLDVPHMREIWENGARAQGVHGSLPTSTYPSHTTMITGASPDNHGIINNQPFDPEFTNPGRWFWYWEELKTSTLWEEAANNGFEVGSVSWPVTVGAPHIHYNIPEFMGNRSDEDITMTRAFANPPSLMHELGEEAGEYITDAGRGVERDWSRVRYTLEMINRKNPEFLSVHLTSTDRVQHQGGPYTEETYEVLEEVDEMIGQIKEAYRAKYPNSAIAIVSDHGFSEVNYRVKIDAAFVDAGFINLESRGNTLNSSDIKDWQAMPLRAGGSSAIYLNDPDDQQLLQEVGELLDELASDPENGIAGILDSDDIGALGGNSRASFWVDFEPGYISSAALTEPFVEPISTRGTHGYSPEQRKMDSAFFIEGPGIREAEDLGRIDMRDIAPTLANYLQFSLPDAEREPLDIFNSTD